MFGGISVDWQKRTRSGTTIVMTKLKAFKQETMMVLQHINIFSSVRKFLLWK